MYQIPLHPRLAIRAGLSFNRKSILKLTLYHLHFWLLHSVLRFRSQIYSVDNMLVRSFHSGPLHYMKALSSYFLLPASFAVVKLPRLAVKSVIQAAVVRDRHLTMMKERIESL